MPPPILFGGSFDPVHHGHLLVAERAADVLGASQVRFVVARAQPLKDGRHGATAEQRRDMLALAVEDNPRFAVEEIELRRPGPSYTIDTLRELSLAGDGRPFLLLGADAVAELPKWRDADEVPQLAELAIFHRPGWALPEVPYPVHPVEVPQIDITATDIRARVRDGRSVRYLVPEPVREYIARHGLYR